MVALASPSLSLSLCLRSSSRSHSLSSSNLHNRSRSRSSSVWALFSTASFPRFESFELLLELCDLPLFINLQPLLLLLDMPDSILLSLLNLFHLSYLILASFPCHGSNFTSPFLQVLNFQLAFLVLLPLSVQILFQFKQLYLESQCLPLVALPRRPSSGSNRRAGPTSGALTALR